MDLSSRDSFYTWTQKEQHELEQVKEDEHETSNQPN